MKAVIGLFEHQADAAAVASFARNSGIADNRVKMLDSASAPADLVEPGPRPMTMRGIRGFTILGLAIFAIFGLSAAITTLLIGPTLEMSSAETQTAAVLITVVFVLIGLFSGVFMGWVKGRSDADNDIQEFREAIEHGATAVVVQTDTREPRISPRS